MAAYRAKYTKMEKEVFGRQLRQLMTDRGMTGADLARQATLHLPKGKVIGRDNISWYVNGRSIPQPIFMTALTRVLKVDEKFLLPRSHTQRKGEAAPPLLTDQQRIDVSQKSDGTVDLVIIMNIPEDPGWEIIALAKKHSRRLRPL